MRLVLSIRASRLSWIFPTNEKLFQGQGQSQGQNQGLSWNKGEKKLAVNFHVSIKIKFNVHITHVWKLNVKVKGKVNEVKSIRIIV